MAMQPTTQAIEAAKAVIDEAGVAEILAHALGAAHSVLMAKFPKGNEDYMREVAGEAVMRVLGAHIKAEIEFNEAD